MMTGDHLAIPLAQILTLPAPPTSFKLHLATVNDRREEPLDVFVHSWEDWVGWNSWRGTRNDFKRRYILSFIRFYPEAGANSWLFGGMFEVTDSTGAQYGVRFDESTAGLVGRLKIRLKIPGRGRAFYLERSLAQMIVVEVLKERYTGERFPGYESIDFSFRQLAVAFRVARSEWRSALESVKGIYLLTDTCAGKRYVGKASGDRGIWGRWSDYVAGGDGGNVELRKLIRERGREYFEEHFRFSLLEHYPLRETEKTLDSRESHWKRVLLTRTPFGYNKN